MADSQPYGDVAYADPGYQKDGKKRYPIDTEEHAKAAWSYINQGDNAAQYTSEQLDDIKGRIKAALKKFGVQVADASRLSLPGDEFTTGQAVKKALEQYASRVEDTAGIVVPSWPSLFMRSFPLEDIHITRSTDGRTVEAYAAVFDVEAEIQDFEGHYNEVIDRAAFNKVLRDARPQGSRTNWNVGVFYNHGMTIHGTPSDRGSMPIGTPLDIRAEKRGLLTVTRYNNNELAEETLEAIRSGSVNSQSFTGRIVRSTPPLTRSQMRSGGYRPNNDGTLQTVRRMELGLREYGPTPMPAYVSASILSVRSLTPTDLRELRALLANTPDPDVVDEPSAEPGTPSNVGAAADEPQAASRHSTRPSANRRRIKAAIAAKGIDLNEDQERT